MSSFNKVLLMGNLTRDPEMRVTPKGTAVTQFGVAVNRTWKDEGGQSREETSFFDVESFGRQAEVVAKHFTKGKPIFLEGRLKQDQWEDKTTGQKRSKVKIILEGFQFIGGNRDDGSRSASEGGDRQPASAGRGAEDPDDDRPF